MDSEIIMVIAVVAIACATGLIKSWMNHRYKNVVDSGRFNKLAEAFMEHKKDMTERVQHLEAIIAEEESGDSDFSQIEVPRDDSSLTNDLKSKDQVRS